MSYTQDIEPFANPKPHLEQYPTGAHLASRMLYTVRGACIRGWDPLRTGSQSIAGVMLEAAPLVECECPLPACIRAHRRLPTATMTLRWAVELMASACFHARSGACCAQACMPHLGCMLRLEPPVLSEPVADTAVCALAALTR
jgi:hypothetical protein